MSTLAFSAHDLTRRKAALCCPKAQLTWPTGTPEDDRAELLCGGFLIFSVGFGAPKRAKIAEKEIVNVDISVGKRATVVCPPTVANGVLRPKRVNRVR